MAATKKKRGPKPKNHAAKKCGWNIDGRLYDWFIGRAGNAAGQHLEACVLRWVALSPEQREAWVQIRARLDAFNGPVEEFAARNARAADQADGESLVPDEPKAASQLPLKTQRSRTKAGA